MKVSPSLPSRLHVKWTLWYNLLPREGHSVQPIKTWLDERHKKSFLCVSIILLVFFFNTHTRKVRRDVHIGHGIDVCDAKSRGHCCCGLLTRCTAFSHAHERALTRTAIRVCEERKREKRSEHKENLEI